MLLLYIVKIGQLKPLRMSDVIWVSVVSIWSGWMDDDFVQWKFGHDWHFVAKTATLTTPLAWQKSPGKVNSLAQRFDWNATGRPTARVGRYYSWFVASLIASHIAVHVTHRPIHYATCMSVKAHRTPSFNLEWRDGQQYTVPNTLRFR